MIFKSIIKTLAKWGTNTLTYRVDNYPTLTTGFSGTSDIDAAIDAGLKVKLWPSYFILCKFLQYYIIVTMSNSSDVDAVCQPLHLQIPNPERQHETGFLQR